MYLVLQNSWLLTIIINCSEHSSYAINYRQNYSIAIYADSINTAFDEAKVNYHIFTGHFNMYVYSYVAALRYMLFRRYSTIDTLEVHVPLKRKIKHRSKKYAELLEGIIQ